MESYRNCFSQFDSEKVCRLTENVRRSCKERLLDKVTADCGMIFQSVRLR